jgi:hypothetical protein
MLDMRRTPFLLAVALLAVPAFALAQANQPAPRLENIKYFSHDVTRDSLVQIMRGFSFALSVRCQYCHAGGDGISFEGVRFASDEKIAKQKARAMLQMTDSINQRLLAMIPGRTNPPVMVTCTTCHRGRAIPGTLETVLTETMNTKGLDSAIAQYRSLRANAMVTGGYDFGQWSINETARHWAEVGKTAEAIGVLRLNQEFYPNSTAIDIMIAEIHLRRNEKDDAIARFRSVLKKEPNNAQVASRLKALGVTP